MPCLVSAIPPGAGICGQTSLFESYGLISLDHRLERWIVHHRVGWLNPVLESITYAGTQGLIWVAVAAVLALSWRRPSVLLTVVIGALVADLTSYGLRAAIPRDRPPLRYPDPEPLVRVPGTNSLPSGHATTSFCCAAILAWLWPRFAVPLFVLAALIAFSRVYVGVHYPLDVLAGALLGLALAVVIRATAPRWRAAGLRRSGRRRLRG